MTTTTFHIDDLPYRSLLEAAAAFIAGTADSTDPWHDVVVYDGTRATLHRDNGDVLVITRDPAFLAWNLRGSAAIAASASRFD